MPFYKICICTLLLLINVTFSGFSNSYSVKSESINSICLFTLIFFDVFTFKNILLDKSLHKPFGFLWIIPLLRLTTFLFLFYFLIRFLYGSINEMIFQSAYKIYSDTYWALYCSVGLNIMLLWIMIGLNKINPYKNLPMMR